MLKPEIARRWLVPLRAKAYARSALMLARSPRATPSRIPLSGSGMSVRSGRPRAARSSMNAPVPSGIVTGSAIRTIAVTATTAAASHASRLDRCGLAAARPAQASPIAAAAAVAIVGATAATAASAVATMAAGNSGSRLNGAARSSDRDKVSQVGEDLWRDEPAGLQLVGARERPRRPGANDRAGGGGSDAGQGVELVRGGAVEVDLRLGRAPRGCCGGR